MRTLLAAAIVAALQLGCAKPETSIDATASVAEKGDVVEREVELVVSSDNAPSRSVSVRIYRDKYGTPQVFSDSNYGVYFGYGHAVANDRLFQMEMLKRTAQGRVAEVLGADWLELDVMLRTRYNHPSVRAQVDALTDKDREILQGYADGFNARIEEFRQGEAGQLPKPFYDYGFEPSDWTAYDVATLFVGSIAHRYADFNSERDNLALLRDLERQRGNTKAWAMFTGLKWLRDADSPTTVPRSGQSVSAEPARPAYLDEDVHSDGVARALFDAEGRFAGIVDTTSERQSLRTQLAQRGFDSHPEFAPASNYWAMSDLSDAKGALLNGPQFDFATPSYVYGIGLHGGDFNVVGSTLLALPSLLFAHNNDIAWGSTAGLSDQTDEFWLELNPDNPEQYRYNGTWREFERWNERINVAGGESVDVTARRAELGMVQAWDPASGTAWVRARAWEGHAVQDMMAWVWLATDRTLEAAEQRIADKTTNINMYTMDKQGRLGYVHSGRYPQRSPGHDPRLPAPGDGRFDWLGMRPYADNPKVREPEQGFITNWNNRPSADWASSDLWPVTWSAADRVDILIDELRANRGNTVQAMVDINRKSSFEDVNHRYLMPLLARAVQGATDPAILDAMSRLRDWDRLWVADSDAQFGPANAIAEAWLRHLLEALFKDDLGESSFAVVAATNTPNNRLGASLATPPGVRALVHQMNQQTRGETPSYDFANGESMESIALRAFELALEELRSAQGENADNWRLPAAPMVWRPFNFRGVPQASPDNQLEFATYQNRGTENNVFIATGQGIVAKDANPGGQGGHLRADGAPGPHHSDQFDLYNAFEYKPVPFDEADIKAQALQAIELEIAVPQ